MKTRLDISAGGVVYRRHEGRIDVCLIRPSGAGTWQLPKGLVDPGEAVEQAAAREVREETGLTAEPERRLTRIEYWYTADASGRPLHEGDIPQGEPVRVHKLVYFFLFRVTGGCTTAHDAEVTEARWVPLSDAESMLSFENERRVVAEARAALAAGGA